MQVQINKEFPEIIINGKQIKFTKREFDVFVYLWEHKPKFCTRIGIHGAIWGANHFYTSRLIDIVICRIRKKIIHTPLKLQTRRGFGYYFSQ